jgi:hypothetical protein
VTPRILASQQAEAPFTPFEGFRAVLQARHSVLSETSRVSSRKSAPPAPPRNWKRLFLAFSPRWSGSRALDWTLRGWCSLVLHAADLSHLFIGATTPGPQCRIALGLGIVGSGVIADAVRTA